MGVFKNLGISILLSKEFPVLAGAARLEHCPVTKVLQVQFPGRARKRGNQSVLLSHINVSLPSSLRKQKMSLGENFFLIF